MSLFKAKNFLQTVEKSCQESADSLAFKQQSKTYCEGTVHIFWGCVRKAAESAAGAGEQDVFQCQQYFSYCTK